MVMNEMDGLEAALAAAEGRDDVALKAAGGYLK